MTHGRPRPRTWRLYAGCHARLAWRGRRWGVGFYEQAGPSAPGAVHTGGLEGREVSGHESLGAAPTLASVDFWGHFHSVLARTKGKTEGFLGPLELYGSAPRISAGAPSTPGGADGQERTDRELLYKVFVVAVGLVQLSICVIRRGNNSHGFWSGSGGHGGCPSPPPGTDTFKRSRATRTQHRCEKRVPPPEQDGRSRLAPTGLPAAPRGQRGVLPSLCHEEGG